MSSANLIHNERLKAIASIFNSLAAGSFIASAIVPLIAANVARPGEATFGYLTTLPAGLALMFCFGAVAQLVLGDLRE